MGPHIHLEDVMSRTFCQIRQKQEIIWSLFTNFVCYLKKHFSPRLKLQVLKPPSRSTCVYMCMIDCLLQSCLTADCRGLSVLDTLFVMLIFYFTLDHLKFVAPHH